MNQKIRIALFAGLILAAFGMAPQAYAEHCTSNLVDLFTAPEHVQGEFDDPPSTQAHPINSNGRPLTCELFVAPILVDARSNPSCEDLGGMSEIRAIVTLSPPVTELKIVGSINSGEYSDPPSYVPTVALISGKNSADTPNSIIEEWEDVTDAVDGESLGYPGQELVYLRAGNLGYAYPYDEAIGDSGLTAPLGDDGLPPTINEVLFCGRGSLCPLSEEYLVKELGPALNPGLKFPVSLPNNFCTSYQDEIPECCNSGSGKFGECTAIDHPKFAVQYLIMNRVGGVTTAVCALPPLAAIRSGDIQGDAFSNLTGAAIVTTKVNPRRDTSTTSTDTTTTTDTSSGGTDSESSYSVGCPGDDPTLCQ